MGIEQVTPENLTLQHIAKWDGAEMRRQMAHPEMREAITNILKSRTLAEVEQVERQRPVEPIVESVVTPVVEPQPIVEPVVPAPVVPTPVVPEPPKKFSVDYQVKDEQGNPIGRPTHLEAATEEELRNKLIEAHTQATRAFHRLKKQKTTFKHEEVQVVVPEKLSDQDLAQAIADVRSEDPKKAAEAQGKITQEERRKLAVAQEEYRQQQVSIAFLRKHIEDFNNCEANVKMIGDYMQENQLAWTLDNLELAFIAKESELAPVVQQAAPVAPVNPAPAVTPVVTTPAAPVVVQPVVPAPVQPAPVNNPVVPAPRPGVNGGLVPGESSGVRPAAKPTGLTAEEIRSWDGATMRKNMANPVMRAQIEAFVAARNAQRGK